MYIYARKNIYKNIHSSIICKSHPEIKKNTLPTQLYGYISKHYTDQKTTKKNTREDILYDFHLYGIQKQTI